MSSEDPIISIRDLGKEYQLGARDVLYGNLKENLAAMLRLRFRRTTQRKRFWALRNVSFDVKRGESVGIIGRNGAGKSTLLKVLSQITEPTEGEVHLFGTVASLLEVGTGFHPELNGRENIYLNGAMLGMSRQQIRDRFDEIVAFSEIAEFLETPVKRYSSGMYVRLAFSVAAHLEPDVLIVDEVLSVGDAAFQKKCLGKMEDVAQSGRTVILVSHNMSLISSFCDRAVWLNKGAITQMGPAPQVVGRYLSEGVKSGLVWKPEWTSPRVVEFHSIEIDATNDRESDAFAANNPIDVLFDFTVHTPLPTGRITMQLVAEDERVIFSSANTDGTTSSHTRWSVGRQRLRCTIPGNLLVPGQYFITVKEPAEYREITHDRVLSFTVSEQHSLVARDGRAGIIAPLLDWRQA